MDERAPSRRRALKSLPALAGAALLLAACGSSGDTAGGRGAGRGGPTQVGYVIVQQGSAPIEQQLPGRIAAFQVSEVRPQVSGVVQRRLFTEGSFVRQGQTLYQIDPSVYNAQAAQAQANLQSARASAEAARTRAARYKPLAQMEAISKQDYTDALAQARQADASVAQNNALLRSAQINQRFTRVPAPISGRIGLSAVTEGALVTANQVDAMTTITRLDPVFVDIQESAADLLALRNALSREGAVPTTAQVRLKLPDGSYYGFTGTVEFGQVLVDQATGTVTLRARFANPQSVLLPGMFVTAEFAQAIDTSAFLVPQPAITRDPKGNATLFVVGPGNKAVQRTVVAERTQGQYWVVTQGLAAGEKVITQGTANLKDGAPIKPVPASAPQRIQAPPPGAIKKTGANQRGGG
ncbi:efflux RND transporter periplasmic adaptor subunit [Sphingomonas sp. URHD0057]|uniref:efflux RND transporter periplasmic adaptor subunit n=1 Tax=Sphingomonas sp. URHD0057 TaxID=1380389 RepID=UPI001E308583|nr:efflux RND transporter periplasmic adaptor subunit [Sphingomonas sp. URHD0057]